MAGDPIGLLLALTYSATGSSGTLATTEGTDIAAFAGPGIVSGTLSTTEATDIASFAGTIVLVPSGPWVSTEAPDVALFTATWKPPKVTISPSPYPSEWDYGWYRGEPSFPKWWR